MDVAEIDTPGASDTQGTRWKLSEGDEIAPGRTALKHLGGGHRYDAYLAFDEFLHSIVVCKVVRPLLVEDAKVLAGLTGEWEMIESLNHPVIVRGFDAVLDGHRPHIVLEHLEGPRLSTLVRRFGPLQPEQLVPLAIQLAAAVHYLSNRDVVHLDIKPANTIMGAPPRMIDLSVAMSAHDAAAVTGTVGTDSYMAPEQADPVRLGPIGTPADIWGLGVSLYLGATGALPYSKSSSDDGPPEVRWPQLVETPKQIEADIPPALADAIMACVQFEAKKRPTARELAERLEDVLDSLPRPSLSKLKPRL